MADTQRPALEAYEEILASAVDRQLAEQRELAQTLSSLRGHLDALDTDVRSSAHDVEGLAAAVLELNKILRDRFGEATAETTSLESRVTSLAATIGEGLRELAAAQENALEGLGAAISAAIESIRADLRGIRESVASFADRFATLETSFGEARDLVGYMRDQSEDFDKVLSGIGDVPERLEGVVSQALRRGLTARAGLAREAEKALGGVVAPVEERLAQLLEELQDVEAPKGRGGSQVREDVRRLALGQVELSSRLEDLVAYIEGVETDRSERERELIAAVAAGGPERGPAHEPAPAAEPAPRAKRREAAKPAASREAAKPAAQKGTRRRIRKPARAARAQTRKASATGRTAAKKPSRQPTAAPAKRGSAKGAKASADTARKRSAAKSGGSRRARTYIPL